MARTKDPHGASVKSWETRARNAGGGGVVQSRGDFAQAMTGVGKARPEDVSRLIDITKDFAAGDISFEEFAGGKADRSDDKQEKVTAYLREGLRDRDLPDAVLDGLAGIEINTEGQMGAWVHSLDPDVLARVKGLYTGETRTVHLNSTQPLFAADRKGEEVATSATHEMGHHAHLSKISDRAALEWARLSPDGYSCAISAHGRTNRTEHFADAFAAYANPGAGRLNRSDLKKLEPKTFAFMERLWRDKTMWQPKGQADFHPQRRGT